MIGLATIEDEIQLALMLERRRQAEAEDLSLSEEAFESLQNDPIALAVGAILKPLPRPWWRRLWDKWFPKKEPEPTSAFDPDDMSQFVDFISRSPGV